MFIVDSQAHIWAQDTVERPWPAGHAHRAHRPVPFTAEDLLAEMAAAGVQRSILVPPSWEGDRNDLCLDAARRYPDRFAVMGRISVHEKDSRATLAQGLSTPGLLGYRFTFHTPEFKRQLVDGVVDWLWPAAEKAQVPLMILPPGNLGRVKAIAQRHPDLKLTIDHMAIVRPARDDAAFAHIEELVSLAEAPNISVKVSCLPDYSSEAFPFRNIHKYIERLVNAFGPQRLFWGADLTRLSVPYPQCVEAFTKEMPFLSYDEREWIMGRAVCSWLNWPD